MKHAYLIVAHNEFEILKKQMMLLDDPRNDFYIHIDKKVKDFPFDTFHFFLKHSKVHYIDRLDIRWGDFNMIRCELRLLDAAVKGNYHYYHLLSGVDLPIKSNDAIHDFFRENDGKELVQYWPMVDQYLVNRTGRFHLIHMKTSRFPIVRKLSKLAYLPIRALHRCGYMRKWDPRRTFAYGGNWFSITHDLACHVLEQKKWICKRFRMTECADEVFLQSIVADSGFRENLYYSEVERNCIGNMRMVDWVRTNGKNPWTFRMEDYEAIIHSPYLFARKFSTAVDAQVVERIYAYVKDKNEK